MGQRLADLLQDFVPSILQISLPHGRIRVKGRFLEILVLADSQGCIVDDNSASYGETDPQILREIVEWVKEGIPGEAQRVPKRRGPENGQDKVQIGLHSIKSQGLTGLLVGGRRQTEIPARRFRKTRQIRRWN